MTVQVAPNPKPSPSLSRIAFPAVAGAPLISAPRCPCCTPNGTQCECVRGHPGMHLVALHDVYEGWTFQWEDLP